MNETDHEEQYGAGLRDRFERLYTPHRMAYIKGEVSSDECPFCVIPGRSDEEGLVVARGSVAYAVLNLFPYNSGHLMVVPYRHVADYTELDGPETAELADFTKRAMVALRAASGAHGFNIGMNQGAEAGAGRGGQARVVALRGSGGDQRVGTGGDRRRDGPFQFANLVAAAGKAREVISFDPQIVGSKAKGSGQSRCGLERCGPTGKPDAIRWLASHKGQSSRS